MTLEEIRKLLEATGIPFAYHHWEAPPALPYGVYLDPYSNNFGADDTVYLQVAHIQIELYADERDLDAETKIEAALTAAGIYYERETSYIQEQRLYETMYEIEV
nr:MAG TPA_asm: tail completion protein [Caudoviricetes sp.]